jgi:hypothetical protein
MDSKAKDMFLWVAKIIDTCNNDFHFEAIDNLIEIHFKNFKDKKLKLDLELLRAQKWNEIHVILK